MDLALYTLATLVSSWAPKTSLAKQSVNTTLEIVSDLDDCLSLVPEDAILSFPELAAKYGHTSEEHQVITEDGYKLTIFRIPGKRRALPILLFHGLGCSADIWLLRGNTSLGITLASEGYDLWFGNVRGNQYSRGHVSPAVESDSAKYWNFTFNEHGQYDLSASIDFVLKHTGAEKLNGLGHSQGTTIFFVLCSTRPEYNEKLNSLTALAPVAYLNNTPPPISTLIEISPILYSLGRALKLQELAAEDSLTVRTLRLLCPLPIVGYNLCAFGILFPSLGFDPAELEPCFLTTLFGYFPKPTSLKNMNHFGQLGFRKTFAQYDYGEVGNKVAYNSRTPPEYDLSKVTTRVVLLVGRNDPMSTIEDVAALRRRLPNVASYVEISRPQCNHIDFVIGKNMSSYLYPHIFEILRLYGNN